MTFTQQARRLAGLATVLLGWRPDDFWASTPEELASIFEAMRPDAPPPLDLGALMERFPDA